MSRPKLVDYYSCQGGAGEGFRRAGWDVYAVDIDPQPHNPHPFHQGDALKVLDRFLRGFDVDFTHPDGRVEWLNLADVSGKHGSPPCQRFTKAQRIMGNEHPDLIAPTRELFQASGVPWTIENVVGAPLRDPLELCGCMFPGLNVYRERWFESSVELPLMLHSPHVEPLTKMGRKPVPGQRMHVVGHFTDVAAGAKAMGIDWMTRDGLREAIPPAYTEWVGARLLEQLEVAA